MVLLRGYQGQRNMAIREAVIRGFFAILVDSLTQLGEWPLPACWQALATTVSSPCHQPYRYYWLASALQPYFSLMQTYFIYI